MVARLDDEALNRVFRALADGTRRDIVRRTLLGEVSVSGLAADYAMSFAAVQKHVAVLEKAGLVRKSAAGRERLVRAEPEQLARARACLERLEAIWAHRIQALDAIFAEDATLTSSDSDTDTDTDTDSEE
ncbi:MAG: winged helix-turn-helix transcriptional regulator [Myxococcales bacterium]|nr:winged helix-turn-helix transcriptional regulator [Myxococcales bacterium]